MFIRPLIQFRQTVETVLNGMTNISKPFVTFFTETMEMYLSISKKINFTQMARFGRSCESRFRQNVFIKPDEQRELAHSVVAGKRRQKVNFRKAFDWITFNRSFLPFCPDHLVTLAIDPCFISKAGKKTPGISYFWSGCASAMKRGLEILGIAAVDAHTRQAVFLKAEQTFTDKLRGRKTGISVDGECYTLLWADVKAVGLEREVRVVIVDCPEPDKKTQKRKVFFSTDLTLTAESISWLTAHVSR